MARDDKTERATPRQRQKAHEKGRVARSRELPAALVTLAGLMVLLWISDAQLQSWRSWWRDLPDAAGHDDFSRAMPLLTWIGVAVLRWVTVPLVVVWLLAVGSSVAQGGLAFSAEALTPKGERLSPAAKLGQMFSVAGLSPPAKSLIPFSVLLYLGIAMLVRDSGLLVRAGRMPVGAIAEFAYRRTLEICWKSTLVLLLWAGIDYLLQRQKLERDLRMSKQELRDEHKETEGNPTVKARLRRLQRQMRRRRMLKEVEHASVVVTNPTHFAVALEYRPEMAAPVLIAKGADLLAQQIKEVARWHEISIVENPPLAQALYRGVEIGQAIPAKLYVAVAEILAFIYRAQMRAQSAGRA